MCAGHFALVAVVGCVSDVMWVETLRMMAAACHNDSSQGCNMMRT
jgi:hypothetical protein